MAYTRNEYVFLQGKAKWAKLVTPDTKFGSKWSVDLYLNDESYAKVLELKEKKGDMEGILNVLKKDEDGNYITLSRPTSKLIKGQVRGFNPPEVLDGSKKDEDGHFLPLRNALVGNGSDITVKVEIYSYPKPTGGRGRAARIESVRVDNLIPFEIKKDFTEEQKLHIKGLDEQPEQLW